MRDQIGVPAILEPHQGTSYNPPVQAHQELIYDALEAEKKRLQDLNKFVDIKTKMEKALDASDITEASGAPGMKIDDIGENDVKEEEEADTAIVKSRPTQRKTKTQRNKELKLRAEVSMLTWLTKCCNTHVNT